ncbi:MAG: DEAD/DEAH box helicase family protein [Gammaproteobacteria bacterium]|nr:DEAD/DEAH box helicase family protein [Gammaproteobacteria bacterium]
MTATAGLRAWQSACIGAALSHYQSERHFFCQATPGAGKTWMSAELARQLHAEGKIDLVVCFAPTIQVVDSFTRTLEDIFGAPFDGQLGSLGGVYTYQSMAYKDERFWSLFDQYRVLVIFDEIHHCASQDALSGNVWGQQIADKIQARAEFTLALSGTPWRTDDGLVALARYTAPEGELVRDYTYGLAQAIEDRVCRRPRIVLLDNEQIERTESRLSEYCTEYFSSIRELLLHSETRYQHFLEQNTAIAKILEIANQRLNFIRMETPDAAGLIVASTVAHANQISNILLGLGEKSTVVSYQNAGSQKAINYFRYGNERWIVSVGMISEGTDIPRLQVCCYLSRVRTELYLRQVLGRILRRTNSIDDTAWLYLYVEPRLEDYCHRIQIDLPSDQSVVSKLIIDDSGSLGMGSQIDQTISTNSELYLAHTLVDWEDNAETGAYSPPWMFVSLYLSEQYVQRVLDLFEGNKTSNTGTSSDGK